jgi:hypothetical protein
MKTRYYTRDEFGSPRFSGAPELKVLGHWVTADIQLSPLAILEAIDLVRMAQSDPDFHPEEMDGNAHTATFSPQGLTIEKNFAEHVRGEFSLDTALAILLDFWDYYVLTHPGKDLVTYCNEYEKENGRDPLAGLRKISRDVPPQGPSLLS